MIYKQTRLVAYTMGIASTVVKEIADEIETRTREFYEFVLPPVDIHMTESEFIVIIDVPGFTKENIDVRLDGNILLVRAKREENENENDKIVCIQRPQKIDKKIRLPADSLDISESVSSAKYTEGVLTITIPRKNRGQNILVE